MPNRAVKTLNKQKVVTVLSQGQQVHRAVQTGLSNDSMTEITRGLREGDVVVLGSTSTTPGNAGRGAGGLRGPGAGSLSRGM